MSTLAAPVVGSPVPLASVAITLMTQVERTGITGFGIASGGPKKQFSTGWHAPAGGNAPPQSVSDVQLLCGLGPVQGHSPPPAKVQQAAGVPAPVHAVLQSWREKHVAPGLGPPTQVPAFTHSLAGPDPLVQSSAPVPLLATSVPPEPRSR